MMEHVNLQDQNQWEAKPREELKIPEVYISRLKFEIVVFTMKKDFTFRCSEYQWIGGVAWLPFARHHPAWRFANVIIDTSKLNPKGEVELQRFTYHPELVLANVPFMVVPAVETETD